MDYAVESVFDEGLNLHYPVVRSLQRPRHVLIEPDPAVGMEMGFDELERTCVLIRGTDLWVPAREAYIAFGGDLIYDVVFEVGFDGVQSPVTEVRYRQRPDRPKPVTQALIRTIRLDALVRRAISENRTAYRRSAPHRLVSVSPEERQAVYLPVIGMAVGEARRRIPDSELQRVAEIYIRAMSELRKPTKAVQEELRLPSRDAAKKRVMKARARGFLPPAPGPRRGGVG